MGPVPGIDNFFVACGFTSGIAASGGAGKAAAHWILDGDPGLDLWAFDIRRFGPLQAGTGYLHDRVVESYAKYYAIHWPGEEMDSARGVRKSPLYADLKSQGAVFGSKFGWERANWFALGPEAQMDPFGWDRPGQRETVGREHKAAREGVVLVDMTSFTKFEISGRGACRFLQYLASANVDRPPGRGVYTQLLNTLGGIEADVTIIRRSDTVFWLITGSALGVRDRDWISRNMRRFCGDADDVHLRDITSSLGVINLAGPLARKVLEKVSDSDVSHQGFPFMCARDIRIGHAPVTAFRVTYIGELGWEVYVPMDYMAHVYETLQALGQEYGIANMGYRAIDITPDDTPLEAGLGFTIDWSKDDFLGAEALEMAKSEGLPRRLTAFELASPLSVFGGEAIFADGSVVAQTTSGNFGFTLGKSLVLGYIPTDLPKDTRFEVQAFGERTADQGRAL